MESSSSINANINSHGFSKLLLQETKAVTMYEYSSEAKLENLIAIKTQKSQKWLKLGYFKIFITMLLSS